MSQTYKPDSESEAAGCRFIVHSENEPEAIELARKRRWAVHGQDYSDHELRKVHLQVV